MNAKTKFVKLGHTEVSQETKCVKLGHTEERHAEVYLETWRMELGHFGLVRKP